MTQISPTSNYAHLNKRKKKEKIWKWIEQMLKGDDVK
jgi:hypothetical protein